MSDHETDLAKLPALGRMLTWVDRPGSANLIFWILAAICVVIFLAGFTYTSHGQFEVENFGGFFAIYGFAMFTLVILASKALRVVIKRKEDYYGNKAVDGEDYPEDQLERLDYDV